MPGTTPAPTNGAGDITIAGTVTAGAEPTCMLLTSDKIEYLLLLKTNQTVAAGQAISVTGHVVHGMMSHCMQGTPFQVTKIGPAGTH